MSFIENPLAKFQKAKIKIQIIFKIQCSMLETTRYHNIRIFLKPLKSRDATLPFQRFKTFEMIFPV